MRLTFVPTTTIFSSLLALYACASGKATEDGTTPNLTTGGTNTTAQPGNGGATTVQPGNGGATIVQGQGGNTATTTATTGTSNGGTTGTSTTGTGTGKGGATATGGAATGGVQGCTKPATPVASWKSFAACQATETEMNTVYNSWKTAYFTECGSQAYIKSSDPSGQSAVVSEGIGYGMLASANLKKSEDFAKLWAFYKARLNGNGVMGWKYPVACSGGAMDSNAASDADIDAAMALIVAAKNFSNTTYLADAKTLIASIKKSETLTNCSGGKYMLKASDGGWAGCDDLNPSYFAPGYYRVFGKVTGDSTFWDKMATDALALLALYQAKMNGQVPDWGRSDGTLGGSSHGSATTYGADACRTPWRVAIDYGWHQTADAKQFLTSMYNGILKKDRPYFAALETQRTSAFVGGYAMVGTGIDQVTADLYFADWYVQRTLPGDNTYYANTLKMLYLISIGGRFDNGQ